MLVTGVQTCALPISADEVHDPVYKIAVIPAPRDQIAAGGMICKIYIFPALRDIYRRRGRFLVQSANW